MKTRHGFVSNSSSASFTLRWKPKKATERSITEEILHVMDAEYVYDEEKSEFHDQVFMRHEIASLKRLIELTSRENGVFVTGDYTSTMNTMFDFSGDIGSLVLAIIANPEYEIVSAEVESD